MGWAGGLALGFALAALALHLVSAVLVLVRLRGRDAAPADLPPISLIRPVCGLDNAIDETLASSFALDYPDYELIFCVARATDPVVPLVERLIAANPGVSARLLVGDDRISGNPKLNNIAKGWESAAHELIVMSDSNVLLPPSFLRDMMARWRPETGMISSPPVGIAPKGVAGALEAAFLNSYQARWQLAADSVGIGYAQGKTLFYRRSVVEAGGGLKALGHEMAEDVASTRQVRAQGLRVRLARVPFPQPIGRRRLDAVWSRQLRWARVRRLGFPLLFLAEVASGAVAPVAALALAASLGAVGWWAVPAFAALWYGAEWTFARLAGWPSGVLDAAMFVLRDLMIPVLWVRAWTGRGFTWRGNHMASAGAAGLGPAE